MEVNIVPSLRLPTLWASFLSLLTGSIELGHLQGTYNFTLGGSVQGRAVAFVSLPFWVSLDERVLNREEREILCNF